MVKSAGVSVCSSWSGHPQPRMYLRINDAFGGGAPPPRPPSFSSLASCLSIAAPGHHPPCRPTRTAHRDLSQFLAPFFRFSFIIAIVPPGRESLDKATIATHRKTDSFRGPTRRPVPHRGWSFCPSRASPDSLFFSYSERDPSASLNTTVPAGRGYG